jgi:DNA-binding MarR family transcriptional regulator
MLGVLRAVALTAANRRLSRLTIRQLATFLSVYLHREESTVRGVAKLLKVSKPAVTRAFDRLCEERLIVRKPDPHDKRSVLAGQTPGGKRFLAELRAAVPSGTAWQEVAGVNRMRSRASPSLPASRMAEEGALQEPQAA